MNVKVLTGRTGRLLPVILQEIGGALHTGRRLLLVVPEQYTMQAELDIVRSLNIHGFMTLEVLSPSRLMERVFERTGEPKRARVTAEGKCMAIQALLGSRAQELSFYSRAAERQGFARRVADTLGDLKRAGLQPGDLDSRADKFTGALREKLCDMATIWRAYEEFLGSEFSDSEDTQQAFIDRLPDSGYFTGACVWVYGFDLITLQMANVLCSAAKLSDTFTLALTWEYADAPDGSLYEPARATLNRLARRFDYSGVQWKQTHVGAPLEAAEPIRRVERMLFADMPRSPFDAGGAIEIVSARTPYQEAERAAARALTLTAGGVRLDEMRVAVADMNGYGSIIATTFERFGIPVYLDRKTGAASHPFFRAILGAVRFAVQGERTDALMDWLKSGFSELEQDEVWQLEVFVRTRGIEGWKWKKPFDAPPPHIRYDTAEQSLRSSAEQLRQLAAEPLFDLRAQLNEAKQSVSYARVLWNFTSENRLLEKLSELQKELDERGLLVEASHCRQVWKMWVSLLDQIDTLFASKTGTGSGAAGVSSTPSMFASMLEAGIGGMELAGLPPERGRLIISQIGQMKMSGVRALFAMCMNEGAGQSGGQSLFTETELYQTEEAFETPIGLDARTLLKLSEMNLLDTLAAPTEFLSVSHSSTDANGKKAAPSTTLVRLDRILLGARHASDSVDGRPSVLYAPGPALDAAGGVLRRAVDGAAIPSAWQRAMTALNRSPEWSARLRRVIAALEPERPRGPLPDALQSELYRNLPYSTTRLERFASCPYSHFVRYGLHPASTKEPGLTPDIAGRLLHLAFERYLRDASQDAAWPDIPPDKLETDIRIASRQLVESYKYALAKENPLNEAIAENLFRTLGQTARTAAYHMQASKFRPRAFEASFGLGERPLIVQDNAGGQVGLEGRIDRIDVWNSPDASYIRVIDYKSGWRAKTGAKLDDSKLYYGLDMQLMLYLAAAMNMLPGTKPAGAFMFKLDEPLIEDDGQSGEMIESQRMAKLKMRGVMLSDAAVVKAMDADIPPRSIAKAFKQDGSLMKNAEAVSGEALDSMIRHAMKTAASIARAIESGTIDAHPVALDAWNSCQWCDCRALCGRGPNEPIKRLRKINRQELLELLSVE